MGSRYEVIVAELRQQIEAGALAPGEAVPSTREITRQWGVAMATATKVLTELRHAGLVRAVPGVGTVVSGARKPAPPRPRAHPDGGLSRQRIVRTAITIADAEGLAAVSMRRVATDLGVATMSLYRHVADKDDLIMHMLDEAFGSRPMPAQPPDDWRARLELATRLLWTLCRTHPWLAPAMSMTRPQAMPNALPYTEFVLQSLDGHGLSLSDMLTVYLTMVNFVRGIAINLEAEAEAEAASGIDSEQFMDTQEAELARLTASGEFPVFARMLGHDYDFDLDNLFETGMRLLLDGLAGRIEGSLS